MIQFKVEVERCVGNLLLTSWLRLSSMKNKKVKFIVKKSFFIFFFDFLSIEIIYIVLHFLRLSQTFLREHKNVFILQNYTTRLHRNIYRLNLKARLGNHWRCNLGHLYNSRIHLKNAFHRWCFTEKNCLCFIKGGSRWRRRSGGWGEKRKWRWTIELRKSFKIIITLNISTQNDSSSFASARFHFLYARSSTRLTCLTF